MANFVFSAFADEAGNSLDEQIAALRANGIGYIEPRNIDGKCIIDYSDEELLAIRKKLDDAGIKTGSVGSPIGKYPIDDDFDSYMAGPVARAIRAAEILGAKYIRVFSFFITPEQYDEKRDEVIRRMTAMANEAKKHGITLCHENEARIYGEYPERVADVLKNVPALGGIFDAANYRMANADTIEGIKATLPSFRYMHIKDAIYESRTIVPAGEGEGRIADVLAIVNEKFEGDVMLTLEPHLHAFTAYASIDKRELKGLYHFDTNREAFDFAVRALEKLLTENGYRKDENNKWKK